MINMLFLNTFLISTMLILPPGLSLKGSKKAAQEKNLTAENRACTESVAKKSCSSSDVLMRDVLNFQRESLQKSESLQQDQQFQHFQEQTSQSAQSTLNDPAFQEWVTIVQNKDVLSLENIASPPQETRGDLYIFVSLSLGEKAFLNLAHEAKRFGATLVLRGFIEGSYTKTAKALQAIIQKTGQGTLIDPELFNLFGITAAPTFVLATPFPLLTAERVQTPLHDRLQGHVSIQYVLETFAKKGDLKSEAKAHLQQASSQKEQAK